MSGFYTNVRSHSASRPLDKCYPMIIFYSDNGKLFIAIFF